MDTSAVHTSYSGGISGIEVTYQCDECLEDFTISFDEDDLVKGRIPLEFDHEECPEDLSWQEDNEE